MTLRLHQLCQLQEHEKKQNQDKRRPQYQQQQLRQSYNSRSLLLLLHQEQPQQLVHIVLKQMQSNCHHLQNQLKTMHLVVCLLEVKRLGNQTPVFITLFFPPLFFYESRFYSYFLFSDEGKSNLADSKEVTFNKLSGKTFPSLVVVARPHLRLKYIPQSNVSQERNSLGELFPQIIFFVN